MKTLKAILIFVGMMAVAHYVIFKTTGDIKTDIANATETVTSQTKEIIDWGKNNIGRVHVSFKKAPQDTTATPDSLNVRK